MKKIFLMFILCLSFGYASQLTKEQKEEKNNLYAEYKEYSNHSYLTIEDLIYDRFSEYISTYIQEKNIKIKSITDFIDLENEFERTESPLFDKYMDKEFNKKFEMKALGALSITYDKYKDYRNYLRKIEPNNSYYSINKDIKKNDFYRKNIEKIKRAMYYNIFSKYLKK